MDLSHELKKCLIPLNWMTAVSGCRLIPTQTRFLNVLDRVQAIVLILCYHFSFFATLHFSKDLVFIFRELVETFSYILFILILRKNVKQLRSTSHLFCHLKASDVRKLLFLNWALFTLKVIMVTHFSWFVIERPLVEKNMPKLLYTIIILYGELNAFITGGFCLYLFYVLAISFAERNIINNIMKRLDSGQSIVNSQKIILQIEKIQQTKETFCQSMSIIPCLWLFFALVRAVSDVIAFQVDPDFHVKMKLVYLLRNLLEVAIMCVVTSTVNDRSKKLLSRLKNKVMRLNKEVNHWTTLLIQEIYEAKQYEFMACGFFPINKQSLLAFVAAFVTFTVLFVQIINQVTQISQP